MPDQAACRAVLPLMTNLETVHFTRGGRIGLPDLNKKAQKIILARNGAKPE